MILTHSPADVVAKYLVTQGIGSLGLNPLATGWSVFKYGLAIQGDLAVAVVNTTPIIEGRLLRGGEQVEHPGIQILVRARTDLAGHAKGKVIQDVLEAVNRVTVTIETVEYLFQSFTRSSSLTFVWEEQSGRRVSSINGTCTIREV